MFGVFYLTSRASKL